MRLPIILSALLLAGAANAQTAASPAGTPTLDKAAMSKACSTQADAKGLHGKARKRFRSTCKRGKV